MEDDGASALALDVDLTRTINFHGITYVVTTRVRRREDGEEVLVVEADQQHTEDRWTGEFTRQYVEEITHKTGNFKKFAVFVRMLLSALQQRSDSVFVDLLTYSDLELLKARKLGQTSVASGTGSRGNNKRYLILTYAVEFDRVHYPLPLVHEDSPSPDAMKRTIRRLKEEIEFLKRNAEDTSSPSTVNSGDPSPAAAAGGANAAVVRQQQRDLLLLQKENADLREALRKQMDETAQAKDKASHVALQRLKQENESLRRELYELEESCEEIRENSAQEIRKLRREAKELVQKLQEQQQKNQREGGAGAKKKAGPTDKEVALRRQVAELEATVEHERTLMKRTQAKHRKEMSELVKQLDKEVASGRILRSRNRDLQRKVAVLSAQQSSNRSTTSSRARSQSASRAGSRPGSNYSSRANSTITSRASSRANSTINSRASSAANSRNASRISSRDSSPRFNSSTGSVPRGRVDTSRIYGTYDEHGVNIRKARAKGSSDSREQVPRPTGAAASGRYRSPYAQPLRSNQRGPAPRQPSPSNGYHSGDSRASSARSAASSSRRAVPPAGATARSQLATSDRHRSPAADASRRRPTPLRRPVDDAARSPSPPARARMRQNHLQSAANGRTSKFDDYEDEAPLLDAPPRRNAARQSPSTGKAGSITRHVDEDEEVYSGQKKATDSLIINGGGRTGAAAVSTKENAPPADSPARGRASSPPAPQARNAWALDQDEAEQPREMAVLRPINVEPIAGMGQLDGAVRKEGPVSSRTDLEVENGGGEGYGRRPGTAGSLDERGGPAADDSGADFDASSEIGEIDRRLNALQNFLKQAKNGIITRIPTTPRA